MNTISDIVYKFTFINHPLAMLIVDTFDYNILEVNGAAERLYQYPKDIIVNNSLSLLFSEYDFAKFKQLFPFYTSENGFHKTLWPNYKSNKEKFFAEIYISDTINEQLKNVKTIVVIDITKNILNEKENKQNIYSKYHFLTEDSFEAVWEWDLLKDEMVWNKSAKKLLNIDENDIGNHKNWWSQNIHPDDYNRVVKKLYEHIDQKISKWKDEYRFNDGRGNYIYLSDRGYMIFDENQSPVKMIGAVQDVTDLRRHEITLQSLNISLEKRAKELAESNEELERFAYVASHDLQEPLRMITSFLQLLEKRYNHVLDVKAREYISFAVDGAERMKKLILDLLEYSRVNTASLVKEDVDLNDILTDLLVTYNTRLLHSNGSIRSSKLPVIYANKTQIHQLFQNLISNAFKYRSNLPPDISIQCEEESNNYKFSITDNGLGIDPRFYDKIFIIFQRLHTRDNYSGTGIGLSICKKIVEKHGGKIWVNSQPNQGSTFYFTIPKKQTA